MAGNIEFNPQGAVVQGYGYGPVPSEQREMVMRAVVHIDTHNPDVGKGSGFIAELPINRVEKKVVLMTCNHVLPSLKVAQKASIYFGRKSKENPGTVIPGQELFNDQFFVTDDQPFSNWGRRFDYTAVEVKTDVIRKYLEDKAPEPLLLTKCAEMMRSEGLRLNNLLYMVHYPKQPKAFDRHENAEHICRIEGPYIGHMTEAYEGSSGSPMLREYQSGLIVVGLHRGDLTYKGHTYINVATLITVILDDIRMVDYDDSNIPDIASFATQAKEHARQLQSLAANKPIPPEEAGMEQQSAKPAKTSNGDEKDGGHRDGDDVLAMKVHGFKTKTNQTHLVILRKYVSQQAISKGKALLAALGLTRPQIDQCYGANPLNEEEAIQKGLEDWIGLVDPTWGDVWTAMETAGIAIQACNALKTKLCQ